MRAIEESHKAKMTSCKSLTTNEYYSSHDDQNKEDCQEIKLRHDQEHQKENRQLRRRQISIVLSTRQLRRNSRMTSLFALCACVCVCVIIANSSIVLQGVHSFSISIGGRHRSITPHRADYDKARSSLSSSLPLSLSLSCRDDYNKDECELISSNQLEKNDNKESKYPISSHEYCNNYNASSFFASDEKSHSNATSSQQELPVDNHDHDHCTHDNENETTSPSKSDHDHEDKTRRQLLLSTVPATALSLAFSLLLNDSTHPPSANAATTPQQSQSSMASAINNNNNNNTTLYENIIPFSSVRKQITLTLPTNNLKVLLVNDKLASQSTVALVVDGAGQLMDPSGVPGLAHLMEHMILSVNTAPPSNTNNGNTKGTSSAGSSGAAAGGGGGGFEEWLENNGGTSNAFTAYQQTCFHYNCPHGILSKSLEKFASLFISSNVISTCHNEQIISREVRRVDSELDLSSLNAQIEYVTKLFVNVEHPYSRFSRGDLNSLERIPRENDINVGEQLIRFFERYYLAKDAVLVVVTNQQSQGSNDLGLLKRWVVGPFSNILVSKSSTGMSSTATAASSSSPSPSSSTNNAASTIGGTTSSRPMTSENYYYPGRFLFGNRYKHLLLYRKDDTSSSLSSSTATIKGTTPNNNNNNEKLIMQWVLNEDYRSSRGSIDKTTNAIEIAFVLNQILGRRGPGSLYLFLRKRGWIQNSSSSLPPQFTVPVNLSGFQVLKITLSLTLVGFLNRSRVVTAVYDSIETLRNDPKNRFSSFDYSSIASTTKSTTATSAATEMALSMLLSIDTQQHFWLCHQKERHREGILSKEYVSLLEAQRSKIIPYTIGR